MKDLGIYESGEGMKDSLVLGGILGVRAGGLGLFLGSRNESLGMKVVLFSLSLGIYGVARTELGAK